MKTGSAFFDLDLLLVVTSAHTTLSFFLANARELVRSAAVGGGEGGRRRNEVGEAEADAPPPLFL
jgi:hypothetical protein